MKRGVEVGLGMGLAPALVSSAEDVLHVCGANVIFQNFQVYSLCISTLNRVYVTYKLQAGLC